MGQIEWMAYALTTEVNALPVCQCVCVCTGLFAHLPMIQLYTLEQIQEHREKNTHTHV